MSLSSLSGLTALLARLTQQEQSTQESKTTVYILRGVTRAPLFSFFITRFITRLNNYSLETKKIATLDCLLLTYQEIATHCTLSFLGQSSWYWIKNMQELTGQEQELLTTLLASYTGPHLLVCTHDTLPDSLTCLDHVQYLIFPETVTHQEYHQLEQLIAHSTKTSFLLSGEQSFKDQVFKYAPVLTLDMAYLLVQYQRLLGKRAQPFFDHWLEHIIPHDQPLFPLSSALLAGNRTLFFTLWNRVKESFSDEFWKAYWSELFWHCYFFLENHPNATQQYPKIPYNFKQRLWQRYTAHEFAAAHAFLYQLDFHHKNGLTYRYWELFYLKFMTGSFKQISYANLWPSQNTLLSP